MSTDQGRRAGVARIHVDLTEREARALVRAATLVTDLLRPELFRRDAAAEQSPLITARQVLIAACERGGVDIGLNTHAHEPC